MNSVPGPAAPHRGVHLCVQWPSLGPYHLARLQQAGLHCREASIRLTALELCEVDVMGRSASELDVEASFERVTVFPGAAVEDLYPQLVEQEIRKALDRLNPDVVAITSYSMPDSRATLAWCLDRGKGAVLMTDSRKEDAGRTRWREWLKSVIVSRFGSALVAGTPQREYLEALGFPSSCIFTGYDVVDNEFFAGAADRIRASVQSTYDLPGLDDDQPFFLSVGRIIRRKGLFTLIDGYELYRRTDPNPWRLVVVGDGNDLAEVQRYIESKKVDGVTFAGDQPAEIVPNYYARAGALVHPALSDQWGLVVNEAMASGLPVIVSEGAGSAVDLAIEEQTGFTFPIGDAARLAERMNTVASNEQLRREMGVMARKVISGWSLDRFAQSLIQAMRCAETRASRRNVLDPGRLLLRVLHVLSRRMTSFHTVEA
ncbi:MAG: glycosyltransferase family 4 protein [Rhodothermales bacterium]